MKKNNKLQPLVRHCLFDNALENIAAFETLPDILKTPDICLAAVQKWPEALKFVPEELKTLQVCLTAVQQDSNAISHVPEGFKTSGIAERLFCKLDKRLKTHTPKL